jgi:hypothetical protein
MDSVEFVIPITTKNPLNGSQGRHWGATSAKRLKEREATHFSVANLWRVWKEVKAWPGWHITLTRVSPKELDSHDAIRAALKSIVDQLVEELGVGKMSVPKKAHVKPVFLPDDRDPRLHFEYGQDFGPGCKAAVRIQIQRTP